jgi:hypothetical protein
MKYSISKEALFFTIGCLFSSVTSVIALALNPVISVWLLVFLPTSLYVAYLGGCLLVVWLLEMRKGAK